MRLTPSPAAQLQAYQTRARIGASLWSRAICSILFIWTMLTLWVIWYRTGLYLPEIHHAYFGRWILCGVINDTPLLNRLAVKLPVYVNGAWYPLPSFTAWLDGPEMYRDSFYSWYWHQATGLGGYYGLGTDLFPLAVGTMLIGWRWRRDPDDQDHLRGLRLLTPRQHYRQLNGSWPVRMYRRPPWGRLNRPTGGSGIKLGASAIPAEKEFEHFLITGSPGSGKSTLIRQMLMQVQDREQAAVVFDVDAEFVQEFYNPTRGDVVLNPLDERCPFWSPWSELRNDQWFPVDAAAMAASIIRGQPRDTNQRFFLESTRTLIEEMLKVVADRDDASGLLTFVSQSPDEIHKQLDGTPAYALVDPQAHGQEAGILSTAINAIKTFRHLPTREQAPRTWSAREWAQNREGWIFLPAREDIRDSIQMLQGLWLDSLVRWLMSQEIQSEQVWIMADELAALGRQPEIEKLMTRGRKRGLAVVLGFQNVSQLREIYGRDSAITLTSSPTTKAILRSDEPETARWCSDLIGSEETERLTMTQLAGLSTYREGVNLSPHRSIQPLVMPAQIQRLAPFTGYLCVAGTDRTTLQIPKLHLTKRHPAFIPRSKTGDANGQHK